MGWAAPPCRGAPVVGPAAAAARGRTAGRRAGRPRRRSADAAVAGELADRLRRAIGELPQQQAAVFCLRYFDDLPYNRIAESLGVETAAVASAVHKARGKLKTMLAVSVHED